MAKFPEAEARSLHNIFVCRRCKTKIRASNMKVLAKKVSCRNCKSKALRPARRK
jgi:ribosomal protein L40E